MADREAIDWIAKIVATTEPDPSADRILDGALASFETFGLRRATVEDVAQAAGVSRVTVYRKYANKAELVSAVFVREARRALVEINAVLAPIEAIADRFVESFVIMLRVAREHPLLTRLLATEPETVLPYLSPTLAISRGLLADQIRGAQRAEVMRAFDPEIVAELLVRMIWSFLLAPESVIDLADDAKARAFVRRFLFSPLRVPRSHPA